MDIPKTLAGPGLPVSGAFGPTSEQPAPDTQVGSYEMATPTRPRVQQLMSFQTPNEVMAFAEGKGHHQVVQRIVMDYLDPYDPARLAYGKDKPAGVTPDELSAQGYGSFAVALQHEHGLPRVYPPTGNLPGFPLRLEPPPAMALPGGVTLPCIVAGYEYRGSSGQPALWLRAHWSPQQFGWHGIASEPCANGHGWEFRVEGGQGYTLHFKTERRGPAPLEAFRAGARLTVAMENGSIEGADYAVRSVPVVVLSATPKGSGAVSVVICSPVDLTQQRAGQPLHSGSSVVPFFGKTELPGSHCSQHLWDSWHQAHAFKLVLRPDVARGLVYTDTYPYPDAPPDTKGGA